LAHVDEANRSSAAPGQFLADGPSDAARRAGHDRDPILDFHNPDSRQGSRRYLARPAPLEGDLPVDARVLYLHITAIGIQPPLGVDISADSCKIHIEAACN